MNNKILIKNTFFDVFCLFLSFFLSFFRSIYILLFWNIDNIKIDNSFFSFLDFILRKWTFYFWKKPSLYKLTSLIWDILKNITKK